MTDLEREYAARNTTKAIANAVAKALRPLVTWRKDVANRVILRRAGDVAAQAMIQVGTMDAGDFDAERVLAVATRLARQLRTPVDAFKAMPDATGQDFAHGDSGEVRVRVVRAYDVQSDEFLVRVDVLAAL